MRASPRKWGGVARFGWLEPGTGPWICFVDPRRAADRHAGEGCDEDVVGRAAVERVVHLAGALHERLTPRVGRDIAVVPDRRVQSDLALLDDDDRPAWMRMPA